MLKINLEFRKGILFVRLKGDLTKYTSNSLNEYLLPIIHNQGIKYLVFNLANIKLIDSIGKSTLEKNINEAKKNNGYGMICNCNNIFNNNIKIVENELSALNYIKV